MMSSHYAIIQEKIALWKKANLDKDCKDYLLIAFTNEEAIYINQPEKVETEMFVIYILKYYSQHKDPPGRVWNNDRFKCFYFTKHEYGDFYELPYIPLDNGWKLSFSLIRVNCQSSLDSIILKNIDTSKSSIEIEFRYDCLESVVMNDKIRKKIQECLASAIGRSNGQDIKLL